MQAVFDHSESTGSDRLLLLAIADACDHDGTGCWKGKETLAAMARVSRATATRSIARLVQLGELEVAERAGTSSLYSVLLPGLGAAQSEPGGRLTREPGGGSPVSRDPSTTRPDQDPEPRAARPNEPEADRIAREWWESHTPRPLGSFVGLRKIVEEALDRGNAAARVAVALRRCGNAVPSRPVLARELARGGPPTEVRDPDAPGLDVRAPAGGRAW